MTAEHWITDAACRGMNAELFYPERGEDVTQAQAVCHTCPVQTDCLLYSIRESEGFGVWGGVAGRHRQTWAAELRRNNALTTHIRTTGDRIAALMLPICEAIENGAA